MAIVPEQLLPKPPRRVLDMRPGERANVGLYAFKVDPKSRVLYLSNTAQINDPAIDRTAELHLDEAGKYHVNWRHHWYEFKEHQLQNLDDWEVLGTTEAGFRMIRIASVANWP